MHVLPSGIISWSTGADIKDDIYKAEKRSNYNPVAYTFPIRASDATHLNFDRVQW